MGPFAPVDLVSQASMVPVPALLRPHLRATLGTPRPHYLTVHAARRGAEAKKGMDALVNSSDHKASAFGGHALHHYCPDWLRQWLTWIKLFDETKLRYHVKT